MVIKKFNIIILIIVCFVFISIPYIIYAADGDGGTSPTITNPLDPSGKTNVTPEILIGRVIYAVLGLVGSLALVMYIYGGFMWMMAAGNPQRVTKGKEIITWATIGLVVIFTSYAAVKFIIDSLGK
jgi:hypothetical protein